MSSSGLPSHARAVVIGGGVGGAAVLYWLARLGWTETVLVERSELSSGSTFHSAGLVGQLRGSLSLTRMMMNSVDLYRRLGDEAGLETGWHEVGSLRLASTEERMEELARQAGWAKTFGLPLELVAAEGAERAASRHADAARPVAARLPPGRVGRPADGWVRAPAVPVGSRRRPRGLQREAARGGLGALRRADAQLAPPGSLTAGRGGGQADQRSRGVHARRRVHPRADGGPGLLGRDRLLRPWPRRRRRHGPPGGGVDRGGPAGPRRLGDGFAPVRASLLQPGVHAGPHGRGLRHLLRRQVSRSRAAGRAPAAGLLRIPATGAAWRRVR